METKNCSVESICINQPRALFYGFIASRVIHTALIVLAVAGVLNKPYFLIGIGALTVTQAAGLALICTKLKICKSSTAIKTAAVYLLIDNLLPLITLAGGMNYLACAWGLMGSNLFLLSSYLIFKGCSHYIHDKYGV